MITQYTSPLIPASVVDGKFPEADEDRLAGLSAKWVDVEAEMTSEAKTLAVQHHGMSDNWSGSGAQAAYDQIDAVTRFASSVSTAAATIGSGCQTAASFVTNAKSGINVVLIHLDNLTKKQILIGLTSPLLVPGCLETIFALRVRARAIISQYSDSLVTSMSGIPFTVDIQPKPHNSSTSTTTELTKPIVGGSSAKGGGSSPSVGRTASTTPMNGGASSPTQGSATVAAAVFTGGLADFAATNVVIAIAKAPLPTDASSGTNTASTTTKDATTSGPGTKAATGRSTGSTTGSPVNVPADPTSNLMSDKDAISVDMGVNPAQSSTTDTTSVPSTAGGGTGSAPLPSSDVSSKLQKSILNQIQGTGSTHDIAKALDHTAPWSSQGGTPAPPTQASPASVSPSVAQVDAPRVTGGGTSTDGSAQQAWNTGNAAHVGGGSAVTANPSASNPAPVGTGAAGSDSSTATLPGTSSAPVPPVMPVTSTTTVFGGSPAGGVSGPSIQIAPGTMASTPTTGFSGASVPSGASPFPTPAANAAPVGTMGAPAAAMPTTATPSSSALPPTVAPASTQVAPSAAQPTTPHEQAGPPASAAQPLRIDVSRGGTPVASGGNDGAVITVGAAIAALGLVGASAQHFTGLWNDLGSTALLRPAGTLLPTQFGREDELLAAMPLGMDSVYQKVLLPGEADQLFAGQVDTLRGLVYPYQAVREFRTPSDLYDALGLGFVVSGIAGSDTLAFNRDAESIEVLRCAGLRQDDLVTPIDTDVRLPAGTLPPPLVRHHRRPWTGTGEAPGSTSENVIEEHEILGYASVGLPHLAEIWRLHADGREEYVSTYNARNGQWVGDTSPTHQQIGRRIDNGAYAGLSDGTVFRTIVLTDRHSVLIGYGVSAPEHFEQAHDGSYRTTVNNSDIISVTGVATIGSWQALPIQLLHRQGSMLLIDYAGDDPVAAAAAGFPQINQGQWQPRWVDHTEVSDIQELERHYVLPRPAEPWENAPMARDTDGPRTGLLAEEVSLGAAIS